MVLRKIDAVLPPVMKVRIQVRMLSIWVITMYGKETVSAPSVKTTQSFIENKSKSCERRAFLHIPVECAIIIYNAVKCWNRTLAVWL